MTPIQRIRHALRKIRRQLGRKRATREELDREINHYASRAQMAHDNGVHADHMAARWRRKGKTLRARWWEGRAARSHARAHARQQRAQNRIAKIKKVIQAIHGLEDAEGDWERQKREWQKTQGPVVNGDTVTGGKPPQRLKGCAMASAAHSRGGANSHYSQSGEYDTTHGITTVPWDHRSDCSSWFASEYRSCGLEDPSRLGYRAGFTGSLLATGRIIDRGALQPGDAVIYGDGNGFHVEMYVGPGEKTIGHGSDPIDAGTIDMISGTKRFRRYI